MNAKKIETVEALESAYRRRYPNGHFFDRDTLRFFGERRSEMRLLKGTVKGRDFCGEEHECYCLSTIQRVPCISGGTRQKRVHHYFDVNTLDNIDLANG